MKRWRFINNWIPCHGIGTFVLFNLWWSKEYIGVGLLNFAVEYARNDGAAVASVADLRKAIKDFHD